MARKGRERGREGEREGGRGEREREMTSICLIFTFMLVTHFLLPFG